MEHEVIVVVGANYGDEGKGLATHYFSQKAKKNGHTALNVLYNGGPQRGHTVEMLNGIRHVFHHFGSGFFDGAQTYFDEDFMVNPVFYCQERTVLMDEACGHDCFGTWRRHQDYIHYDCRVTTPWDCLCNQIVEEDRGKDRHGSCGFGIWETQKRYEATYGWSFGDLATICARDDDAMLRKYLHDVRDNYIPIRLSTEYHIYEIPKRFHAAYYSEDLVERYIQDLKEMVKNVIVVRDFEEVAQHFHTIIFEAGQGLALDEGNKEALPHVTASKTGSAIPVKRVDNLEGSVDICYVTRSYFTRHGAGPFPTECPVMDLGWENVTDGLDLTNVPNQFQGHFRYGTFGLGEFSERIVKDQSESRAIRPSLQTSCMITHLNETDNDICGNAKIKDLEGMFDALYLSDSHYSEDIKGRYHSCIYRSLMF